MGRGSGARNSGPIAARGASPSAATRRSTTKSNSSGKASGARHVVPDADRNDLHHAFDTPKAYKHILPMTPIDNPKDKRLKMLMSLWRFGFQLILWFVVKWVYVKVFEYFPDVTPHTLVVLGTTMVHDAVFWPMCLILAVVDINRGPWFIWKYKIQKHHIITVGEHVKAAVVVLLLQKCVALPVSYAAWAGFTYRGTAARTDPNNMPGLFEWGVSMVLSGLFAELNFYFSHRALHWGPLYKKIHKMHHTYTAPVAQAAEYAHPIEYIFGNIFTVIGGPMLLGSHCVFLWFFMALSIFATINGHSGYATPWAPFRDPRSHDYHHYAFKANYGTLGLLDKYFGTDAWYTERDMNRIAVSTDGVGDRKDEPADQRW